ncbi:MAG: SANT/Myb-like DNA-binding domain-containing protein [Fimbriimonadaceae bacterium]|nr:SANT/Myb-like DNA-binding domain-containing protein [Fimbriimonadaceae bacterium]
MEEAPTKSRSYRPWTREEDERLLELHFAQKPLEEIAREMSRTKGAIRSRLAGFSAAARLDGP